MGSCEPRKQTEVTWLPALWDRIGIKMGLDAFRERCMVRVDALNHALRRIGEERIRYHLCWGSWHGPHAIEMIHMVDIMLRVKTQACLFEAANARHEHEHVVWEKTKLPAGKIIMPGVVTHSTDVVEPPS